MGPDASDFYVPEDVEHKELLLEIVMMESLMDVIAYGNDSDLILRVDDNAARARPSSHL